MLDHLEQLPALQKARELSETHIAPLIAKGDAVVSAYLPADRDVRIAASLAGLALVTILLWRFLRRRKASVPPDLDLPRATGSARLLVYLSSAVLLLAIFA